MVFLVYKLLAKKGDMGPMMWIIIGIIVILAVTLVILAARDNSFAIIDKITGGSP